MQKDNGATKITLHQTRTTHIQPTQQWIYVCQSNDDSYFETKIRRF